MSEAPQRNSESAAAISRLIDEISRELQGATQLSEDQKRVYQERLNAAAQDMVMNYDLYSPDQRQHVEELQAKLAEIATASESSVSPDGTSDTPDEAPSPTDASTPETEPQTDSPEITAEDENTSETLLAAQQALESIFTDLLVTKHLGVITNIDELNKLFNERILKEVQPLVLQATVANDRTTVQAIIKAVADARINLGINSQSAEKKALAEQPKSGEKIKLNLKDWPDEQKPPQLIDLEKKIALVAAAIPKATEGELKQLQKILDRAAKIVEGDLLASGQQIDTLYSNATEVKLHIREKYLDKANDLKKLTAENVLDTLKKRLEELKEEKAKQLSKAETEALNLRIKEYYDDPSNAWMSDLTKELDPKLKVKDLLRPEAITRLRMLTRLSANLKTFLESNYGKDEDVVVEPGVKAHFQSIEEAARNRREQLEKHVVAMAIDEIGKDPSAYDRVAKLKKALDTAEKVVADAVAAGTEVDINHDAFLDLAFQWKTIDELATSEELVGPGLPLNKESLERVRKAISEKLTPRVNKLMNNANSKMQESVDAVLKPKKPLSDLKFSELREMNLQIKYRRLKASGVGMLTEEYLSQSNKAEKIVKEALEIVGSRDPMTMPWEYLADEIGSRNLDIYDHGSYSAANVSGEQNERPKQLYQAFHSRKTAPESGETREQMQERVDWATKIRLYKMQDILQYEGQVAACGRENLFEQLRIRDMARHEMLKALFYHPDYGPQIQKVIKYIIKETADLKSPITYDIQASPKGRRTLQTEVRKRWEHELRDDLKDTPYMQAAKGDVAREKFLIDEVFNLIFKTYYSFSLIDVGFADLQSGTKTKIHDQKNRNDYTFISRPDAAMMHRLFRYTTLSNWAGQLSIKMKPLPHHYGLRDDLHLSEHHYEELQNELLLYQNSDFSVEAFTGPNGLEPSSLFRPWFPDMLAFLSLKPGEYLEIGDEIYGIDADGNYGSLGIKGEVEARPGKIASEEAMSSTANYPQAEAGWKKILECDLGALGDNLTEHDILHGHSPKLGLIDDWTKNFAGQAKLFQGDYLRPFIEPMLTHYIYRIFAKCHATGVYRDNIFRGVITKIEGVAVGGLKDYHDELMNVIRNISHPKYRHHPEEVVEIVKNYGRYASSLSPNALLSDDLLHMPRYEQRKAYLINYYNKQNWPIPKQPPRVDVTGSALPTDYQFFQWIYKWPGYEHLSFDPEVMRLGDFEAVEKKQEAATGKH